MLNALLSWALFFLIFRNRAPSRFCFFLFVPFFREFHYSILIGCRSGPVVVVDFRTRWLRIQWSPVFRCEEKLSTPILRLPGRSENIYRTFNRRSKTPADVKRESLAVHQEIKYGCYCFKTTFLVHWQRFVSAAIDSLNAGQPISTFPRRIARAITPRTFRFVTKTVYHRWMYKPFVVLHRRV